MVESRFRRALGCNNIIQPGMSPPKRHRSFREGPGERNVQYRHGERTKAVIAERQKFSALLKMLRAGLM
jgi:hypothetical protein